jgi:signal peptidase I
MVVNIIQAVAEVVILFCIITAMIGSFEIQQTSMDPTFHEGQRVVVNKLGATLPGWLVGTAHAGDGEPPPFAVHRGQVVVFNSLSTPGEALIKRAIGLPGDTVELRDGAVFVNGVCIEEPYVHGQSTLCYNACDPIHLGAGQYFMLGDNRAVSLDSRSFGPVPAEKIIGTVLVRLWPPEKFGADF